MIINFSVKNFRSIKDEIILSFEATSSRDLEEYYVFEPKKGLRLLKLGIIYGPNASGKTNILYALDFLRDLILEPLEKKTDTFDFDPFLFDPVSRNKNTHFSLDFIQNEVKYHYEVELNKNAVIKEKLNFHKPNKSLLFERSTDFGKKLTKIIFGNKIEIKPKGQSLLLGNTLWNRTVLGGYLKTNLSVDQFDEILNWFEKKLKPIVTPRSDLMNFVSNLLEEATINKNIMLQLLKKADLGISDFKNINKVVKINEDTLSILKKNIEISGQQLAYLKELEEVKIKELYFVHTTSNNKYILPIKYESEGTRRYFEISGLLSLMIIENSIIFIDELESSLHPDLLKHFLLTFLVNASESQLIATTHHRELLMEKHMLRNDVIWFTEKRKDLSTDLFSLSDFDTSVVRNTSSIYNAYKIGKLGASPNLRDQHIDFEHAKK